MTQQLLGQLAACQQLRLRLRQQQEHAEGQDKHVRFTPTHSHLETEADRPTHRQTDGLIDYLFFFFGCLDHFNPKALPQQLTNYN